MTTEYPSGAIVATWSGDRVPDRMPTWPKAGTQAAAILKLLWAGYRLTPLDILNHCDCLSGSQRIGDLIKLGWPIKRRMVQRGRKRVAEYSL